MDKLLRTFNFGRPRLGRPIAYIVTTLLGLNFTKTTNSQYIPLIAEDF